MRRTLLPLAAALVLTLGSAGAASAAAPTRVLATPAQACRTLAAFHVGAYTSFETCMDTINADIAAYRFPSDDGSTLLSLDQRCAEFEAGLTDPETGETLVITYPFTFEEGPQWPFPVLTANNHRQCEVTLYTYHALASLFG